MNELESKNELASNFLAFVEHVIAAVPAEPALPEAREEICKNLQEAINRRLDEQLVLAARSVWAKSSTALEDFELCCVAFADEWLVNTQWSAHTEWVGYLLEERRLGTTSAGERVFSRIERIVNDREPSQRSTGECFLLLLLTGFSGRFRGLNSPETGVYTMELYQFVHGAALRQGDNLPEQVSKQPYEHTRRSSDGFAAGSSINMKRLSIYAALCLVLIASGGWWLGAEDAARQALPALNFTVLK